MQAAQTPAVDVIECEPFELVPAASIFPYLLTLGLRENGYSDATLAREPAERDHVEAGEKGFEGRGIDPCNPASELVGPHAKVSGELVFPTEARRRCAEDADIAVLPVHRAKASKRRTGSSRRALLSLLTSARARAAQAGSSARRA
jgi:hypothetical protein